MLHLEDSADLSSQYIGTIGTPPQCRRKIFANTEKIFVQVCPPAARSTPPATCAPSPAGEPPPREAPLQGSSRRWRKYLQTTRKIFVLIQKIFQVDVPVVSDDDCRDSYGQNDIADSMICAGLDAGGKDSCQVKLFLEWFFKYFCAKTFIKNFSPRATLAAPSCAASVLTVLSAGDTAALSPDTRG